VDSIEQNCPHKFDDQLNTETFKWTICEDIKDSIRKQVSEDVANLKNATKTNRCLKSLPSPGKKNKRARSASSHASNSSSTSNSSKKPPSEAPSPKTVKAAQKQEAMRAKLVAKAEAAAAKKQKADDAKATRKSAVEARKAAALQQRTEEKRAKQAQLEDCVSAPPYQLVLVRRHVHVMCSNAVTTANDTCVNGTTLCFSCIEMR
jgi:hypothetical protein